MKRMVKELMIILFIYIIFRSCFFLGYVPSASMEPALRAGSFILASKIYPEIRAGDIIVFEREGELLVKRVAYTAGDHIPVKHETDAYGISLLDPVNAKEAEKWLLVPEGYVYVLGDNQDHSYDSRYWETPFVSLSEVCALVIADW